MPMEVWADLKNEPADWMSASMPIAWVGVLAAVICLRACPIIWRGWEASLLAVHVLTVWVRTPRDCWSALMNMDVDPAIALSDSDSEGSRPAESPLASCPRTCRGCDASLSAVHCLAASLRSWRG
jgi:hypothetical protein